MDTESMSSAILPNCTHIKSKSYYRYINYLVENIEVSHCLCKYCNIKAAAIHLFILKNSPCP